MSEHTLHYTKSFWLTLACKATGRVLTFTNDPSLLNSLTKHIFPPTWHDIITYIPTSWCHFFERLSEINVCQDTFKRAICSISSSGWYAFLQGKYLNKLRKKKTTITVKKPMNYRNLKASCLSVPNLLWIVPTVVTSWFLKLLATRVLFH